MKKVTGAGISVLLTALTAVAGADTPAAPAGMTPVKIEDARIDRWDPALDAIVPKDWKIEKLAQGFGWAEGPVWIKAGGYLLFSDVPGSKLWKWTEKAGLEKFLDPSGPASFDPEVWRETGANGLAVFDAHSILLAASGVRGLLRLDLATT